MLHKNTKILVAISAIIFVVSVAACIAFFWIVSKQKAEYAGLLLERAQAQVHQEALQSLVRTLDDTKQERSSLLSRVLKDDEVINFLALIETLGKEQGVTLTTNSLNVLPGNGTFETLVVNIGVEGSYEEVSYIIRLLEQLPYQSTVNNVKMSRDSEGEASLWKGSFEVKVTKLKKI